LPHRHWTFSIPRILRGLFERALSLPGLLSQKAYASILKCFKTVLGRKKYLPRLRPVPAELRRRWGKLQRPRPQLGF
jgi:hypothetical protein